MCEEWELLLPLLRSQCGAEGFALSLMASPDLLEGRSRAGSSDSALQPL